jgi:aminopeptidase N
MAALLAALPNEQHPKVRRAIATALGEFREEAAATALAGVLNGDKTDTIESAAASALGKTRQASAFDTLKSALDRDSFNQVVRQGALNGLVALKDERAIPVALEWTIYGKADQARYAAIGALGSLGKLVKDKEKEQVVDRLKELLEDKNWRARIAAIGAAEKLGDPELIPLLQRKVDLGEDGREVRRSREAIIAIREHTDQNEEVKKLRDDLDKLQTENRELRDRLESLEERLK